MRRPVAFSLGLAAVVLAYVLLRSGGVAESRQEVIDPAKVIVVRTPGGLLEVASLERSEAFGWSLQFTCPFVDCSKLMKPTISEVRAQVRYVYRIELAAQWQLVPKEGGYLLRIPALQPAIPVAIDTRTIDIKSSRGWFSPRAAPNEAAVVRHLGPELIARAQQKSYLALVKPQAEKTVLEFAQKWMASQHGKADRPIKVQFDGLD